MTDQEKPESEDLDEQNGELLPEREVMSIISNDITPVEPVWPDHDVPPPDPPQT